MIFFYYFFSIIHYSFKSDYSLFINFFFYSLKIIGLFIIFRPSVFTIHYFFGSLFTIHYTKRPLFTNHYTPSRPSCVRLIICLMRCDFLYILLYTKVFFFYSYSPVADPEGVQQPPFETKLFLFHGDFSKKSGKKIGNNQVKLTNRTPFVNLNSLSRNPGFAIANHSKKLFFLLLYHQMLESA